MPAAFDEPSKFANQQAVVDAIERAGKDQARVCLTVCRASGPIIVCVRLCIHIVIVIGWSMDRWRSRARRVTRTEDPQMTLMTTRTAANEATKLDSS